MNGKLTITMILALTAAGASAAMVRTQQPLDAATKAAVSRAVDMRAVPDTTKVWRIGAGGGYEETTPSTDEPDDAPKIWRIGGGGEYEETATTKRRFDGAGGTE